MGASSSRQQGHPITRGHLKQGAVSHNSQSSDPKHPEANFFFARSAFTNCRAWQAQQMLLIDTSIQPRTQITHPVTLVAHAIMTMYCRRQTAITERISQTAKDSALLSKSR
jgi:hypothetical protein